MPSSTKETQKENVGTPTRIPSPEEKERLLQRRRSILKSLIIPDNTEYDGFLERAAKDADDENSHRSLRKRDHKVPTYNLDILASSSSSSSSSPSTSKSTPAPSASKLTKSTTSHQQSRPSTAPHSSREPRSHRRRSHIPSPTIEEVELITNPNVQVDTTSHGKHFIKIKYDKSKFFQFRDPSPLRKTDTLDIADHEMDDFNVDDDEDLDTFESEDEMLYRGALPKSSAVNDLTIPTREDRVLFKKLLKKSEPERLRNNTVILNQDFNEDPYSQSSKIRFLQFRDYEIQTWYTAPYPEEYSRNRMLYICEHCLKYMSSKYILHRHKLKCDVYHPPGNEIYRHGDNAIFEIDGRKSVIYCQNLCLLAKLFLNSKTLYYDVEPFMFYVLTEIDPITKHHHFVGYFSKEKLNSTNYNVSCILTLPIYQRKGYGNLLMDFSYLLSRREFKQGTPEKPLSDLGLLSYRNYWKIHIAYILKQLHTQSEELLDVDSFMVSIEQLANLTGMIPSDVVVGLEQCEALLRDQTSGKYAIRINPTKLDEIIAKWESKKYVQLNPDCLLWKPMIYGLSCGVNQVGPSTVETLVKKKRKTLKDGVEDIEGGNDDNDKTNNNYNDDDADEVEVEVKSDPMKTSIELLASFLKDDVDDSRDIESQTFADIFDENAEDEDDQNDTDLSSFVVCYPGMELNKRKAPKKSITIEEEDDDEEYEGVPNNGIPVGKVEKVLTPKRASRTQGAVDSSFVIADTRRLTRRGLDSSSPMDVSSDSSSMSSNSPAPTSGMDVEDDDEDDDFGFVDAIEQEGFDVEEEEGEEEEDGRIDDDVTGLISDQSFALGDEAKANAMELKAKADGYRASRRIQSKNLSQIQSRERRKLRSNFVL